MAVREPQMHEPGACGYLPGEIRAYHIGVQKGDKSLLLEGDLSPSAHTSRSCRNSVFASADREAFYGPPTRPAPSPAPHLSAAPRGRPSSTCGSEVGAQPRTALGPCLQPWCPAGAGQGPGHGIPPTPPWAARPGSFCGRNSPSRSPRAGRGCGAAGRRRPRRNATAAAAPSPAASLGLAASRHWRSRRSRQKVPRSTRTQDPPEPHPVPSSRAAAPARSPCQSRSPGPAARASAGSTATPPPAWHLLPGTPKGARGRGRSARRAPGRA